ncbi:MAG: helix-turn-helix transcriptional regulator [Clostridia bacterium]|nr:helix-turn-helix transcriptional regulator [Clostridia bacterium]
MTKCTVFPVIDLAETGRMIERSRKAAGLSVKDIQTYFGFEYPQAVYKWQHGECLPSVDNLLALSRLLGTPMEDLLVFEDQEVPYFLVERSYLFFWT